MKYTLYKEIRGREMVIYSLINNKGRLLSIKAIRHINYEVKKSVERNNLAKTLMMLRKMNFLATELHAIQKLPPLEYLNQLKSDGLMLFSITYDKLPSQAIGFVSYDMYGLSTHESHALGQFFYRIYDYDYYRKVLSVLLPLIQESGIECSQKGYIITGDSRTQ